jgi:hypothetical protein
MKQSLSNWASKRRWTTLLLLALGAIAMIAAFVVGINDNPPGLALTYLSVTAFFLAWVHPWRSVKRFLVLLGACLVGFPVAVVLHNLFYALSELAAQFALLAQLLGFLEGVFFIGAVLVCPPGVVVGAVGAVALAILRFLRARRGH